MHDSRINQLQGKHVNETEQQESSITIKGSVKQPSKSQNRWPQAKQLNFHGIQAQQPQDKATLLHLNASSSSSGNVPILVVSTHNASKNMSDMENQVLVQLLGFMRFLQLLLQMQTLPTDPRLWCSCNSTYAICCLATPI